MVNNATNIWKNEQSLTSKKTMTYDIENPDTAIGTGTKVCWGVLNFSVVNWNGIQNFTVLIKLFFGQNLIFPLIPDVVGVPVEILN